MTVADVLKRVEIIRLKAKEIDDEAAHGREDDLHHDVLRAIADGAHNPKLLARAALKTLDLKFSRHCA